MPGLGRDAGRGAGASTEGQPSTGMGTTPRPQNGVDAPRLTAGCWRGSEGDDVGSGSRKASVSWLLLGAAAGPRAGRSVSAASPGYFIKGEEKKVSGRGGAGFL